jgi:hypothetical protein
VVRPDSAANRTRNARVVRLAIGSSVRFGTSLRPASGIASDRVRIRLREHTPASIAHPHLARAGRFALCSRHGQSRAGEAVVRHYRRRPQSRRSLSLPNPYESMQFLIDRGIDMTIKDYRWDSTATGWARYGKSDEQMAQWLKGGGTGAGTP